MEKVKTNNKYLMIVDPQNDFIDNGGSLSVPNSKKVMDELVEFIKQSDFTNIIITKDWHPENHISFVENGGVFPKHCVQNTEGAKVYVPLFKILCNIVDDNVGQTSIFNTKYNVKVLTKGDTYNTEEFSIFNNIRSAEYLKQLNKKHKELYNDNTDIELYICGLAGDICVRETIKDAIEVFGLEHIHVLTKYSPSLDDGTILKKFIVYNNINSDLNEQDKNDII